MATNLKSRERRSEIIGSSCIGFMSNRARKGAARAQLEAAITTYTARWTGWVTGGLPSCEIGYELL
jgi:hypothetical protein